MLVDIKDMTAKLVDNIGDTISRHSVLGMVITFVSAFAAKAQEIAMVTGVRETVVSLAADMGIIVGFLIGLLTLAIKSKDFYKKYFKDDKEKTKDEE